MAISSLAPDLVIVGAILRPVGLHGEVKVRPLTDRPAERFRALGECFVWDGSGPAEKRAVALRRHEGEQAIVWIEGFATPEAARALQGKFLAVPREHTLPAPDGHFYPWQLAGAEVTTPEGRVLGRFAGVEPGATQELWVVETEGRRWLLPAVPELVREVSVAERRIVVDLPDGLMDV
jgi:16S rRNA processing protein RimM